MHTYPTPYERLQEYWPLTTAAVRQCYCPTETFCRVQPDGTHDAGYLLAGLGQYEELARDRHGADRVPHAALDAAACRETFYQYHRGRTFRRAVAALSTCYKAIVVDRPEKIFAAARKGGCHASAPTV